jgi:carboxypeptidase C (cathepsin A)
VFLRCDALAQTDKTPAQNAKPAATDKPSDDKASLPPLPAEAHTQQSIQLNGKTLKYNVTVGALPVRDKEGCRRSGGDRVHGRGR